MRRSRRMFFSRRSFLGGIAALAAAALPLSGAVAADAAANYPSKPIRLIVPYPAGGGTDTLARLVGNHLSNTWNQTVVVENVAGASGQVGLTQVVRSEPDGHTIALTINAMITAPFLYKNVPYDVLKSFAPIGVLAYSGNMWLVPADSPLKTFQDLLDAAKRSPGQLSYASYGTGTTSHLYMEAIKSQKGIDLTHVPYKGAAPVVNDTLGGHVTVGVADISTAAPHVKAGKLRVLAVSGARKVAFAPDAPLLEEFGITGVSANGWFGFVAPAATPEAIVNKLSAEIAQIVAKDDIQEALNSMNLIGGGSSPQEMAEAMAREYQSFEKLTKEVGLQPE